MLLAPKTKKEFTREWARKVLVNYKLQLDKDWLLADMLKVLDCFANENNNPGMLSHSFILNVTYKESTDKLVYDSWFVKIPKTILTSPMDSVEVYMYNEYFPYLASFIHLKDFCLPVPRVLYASHSQSSDTDIIVMDNYTSLGYIPLCVTSSRLAYMRATMRSLALIHSASKALHDQENLQSKFSFLKNNNLPNVETLKENILELLPSYLLYISALQSDLRPQLNLLLKFQKYLYILLLNLQNEIFSKSSETLVHGDSKIDNFLYKKTTWSSSDEPNYTSVIVDWQGSALDHVFGDLMWTLNGFLKTLPDKNETVDSFTDYSLALYHKEVRALSKQLGIAICHLPEDEYDAVTLCHTGFVYEFLKMALIRPLLKIKNKEALLNWGRCKDEKPPNPEDIFPNGMSSLHFIHLYFTIATEIGVFHKLGELCIASLREAMFQNTSNWE